MRSDARFEFRPLSEPDLVLLWEWLNRPHVAARWGGPTTLERVHAKYRPRLAGGGPVTPYLACLDGVPVGFIQPYWATQVADEWPEERDPGVMGIDQFLADAERLDRGLGTEMVRQFVTRLFEDPGVTRIQTDPSPDNNPGNSVLREGQVPAAGSRRDPGWAGPSDDGQPVAWSGEGGARPVTEPRDASRRCGRRAALVPQDRLCRDHRLDPMTLRLAHCRRGTEPRPLDLPAGTTRP